MADVELLAVEIRERAAELEHEDARVGEGHVLALLREHFGEAAESVGDELENEIQVEFVGFVSACVEAVLEGIDVGVRNFSENGEFAGLESFVLENFLDGDVFARFDDAGEIDDAEGTVADDALGVVSQRVAFGTSSVDVFLLLLLMMNR